MHCNHTNYFFLCLFFFLLAARLPDWLLDPERMTWRMRESLWDCGLKLGFTRGQQPLCEYVTEPCDMCCLDLGWPTRSIALRCMR